MSDAQYHEDEEQYHDYMIRDANDDDSGYRDDADDEIRFPRHIVEDSDQYVEDALIAALTKPQVGMLVSYHGEGMYLIAETNLYDDDPGWVKLDNGQEVDFYHCCEVISQPCPVCFEHHGFHDDEKHRKDIDPKHLLKKGWHLERVK